MEQSTFDINEITYYKAKICPKCIPASRFLKKLKEDYPGVKVNEVEILFHMKAVKKAGIHSIPVIDTTGKRFNKAPTREEFLQLIGIKA